MGSVLEIDVETFSDVDLIKCGVYAYADSPAFEMLLFAYSFDSGETQVVDLAQGEELPGEVVDAIYDDAVIKTAFNANFERTCLSKHFGRYLYPDSWHCSAVQAAMLALPRCWDCAWAGTAEDEGRERFNPIFLCAMQAYESQRREDTEPSLSCTGEVGTV